MENSIQKMLYNLNQYDAVLPLSKLALVVNFDIILSYSAWLKL